MRDFYELREDTSAAVAQAAQETDPAPQKKLGPYRKGRIDVGPLTIEIENIKGGIRSGVNKDGKEWSVGMPAHYGYMVGTEGADGDEIDVWIGDDLGTSSDYAFIVNQRHLDTGKFDEVKVMLGFETIQEAIWTYDSAYGGDLGPRLRMSVVSTTTSLLESWIKNGNTKERFPIDYGLNERTN